ncbi:MAG: glycosyltransferase family 1 protein [Chryseolinea sp.]
MKAILIGNYWPDKQESMERFAQLLSVAFSDRGITTEIWRPRIIFGRLTKSTTGVGKWIGYIDKWILFPLILLYRLQKKEYRATSVHFHVCDHSNAPYLKSLPLTRTSITCHDVLAIRGAFGHTDAYCPASPAGVILQKWILHRLLRAQKLITTTQMTMTHLLELGQGTVINTENWRVITLALSPGFRKMPKEERDKRLAEVNIAPGESFILHVGSGLPRKNRKMLLDMTKVLGKRWNGRICFAGEKLNAELLAYAEKLGLTHRVFHIKPNQELLVALYNACDAFIFPSFSEGFGWPGPEAQACGAPVIASSLAPMPEVSGGGALLADPYKPEEFANAFLRLQNEKGLRESLIRQGFENVTRFEVSKMLDRYLELNFKTQ